MTFNPFEENKEYVAEVLFSTADKRLLADGAFARVGDLPADWPSYDYQRLVNVEGSPTEQVVRLRMASAGHELLRAREEILPRAAEIRIDTLDAEVAPNTAPAEADKVTPVAATLVASAASQGRI